ncbi:MAG: rod shape-determining protein MreC [Betaproteobacteria bacterium]
MDYSPPPFFNRGPAPLVRLSFFVVLAILLMVLDARFRYADTLRQVFALVAYPVQQVAMAPLVGFNKASEFFTSQSALRSENEKLRAEQLKLGQQAQVLQSLESENAQMRQLLDARGRLPRETVFAEILYSGRDPFSRKVVINKGAQNGIKPGQAVVDHVGVIGQVTRVHPLLAEITLITDKDQAIPVQVVRNGLRAVAFGGGDGTTLDLRYMAANAEIQNGDLLVTSGIDGTYPPGLPVARVARIERDAAYAFAKIACTPEAGANQHRQVLVLLGGEELPARPEVQPAPQRSAKSKKQRKRE